MPITRTPTTFEAVLREHEELRGIIADLEEYLTIERPGVGEQGFQEWASGLSERVVRLHDKVALHFRREDEEGVMEQLVLRHPRASRQVEEFQTEHGQILQDLQQLTMASLNYAVGREPEDPRLRQRLKTTLEQLAHHERGENELMMSVEYDDLGTGD